MWQEGQPVPKPIELPCGNIGIFDKSSGIGYRCNGCFAVIGSIGMPRECYEMMENKK